VSVDIQPRAGESEAQPFYIAAHDSLVDDPPRTLKHGDTFALFDHYGDLASRRGNSLGIYHRDTRHLSRLKLTVERCSPLLLSSTVRTNNALLDVDLTNPDLSRNGMVVLPKDTIHIQRMKFLWQGVCHETITCRNYGDSEITLRIDLDFDADFADLFEVRGFKRTRRGQVTASRPANHTARFEYASLDGTQRRTDLEFSPAPAELQPRHARFALTLGCNEHRSISVSIRCFPGDENRQGVFKALRAARRAMRDTARRSATITTSNSVVNEVLARSTADIGMLLTDTEHGPYPYAGVPWFSTAFGRDGIVTAMQLLWLNPSIARGVLLYLAAYQSQNEDPARDAEPGKILHETRKGELAALGEVPFGLYYGSIDSTPLFICLAGMYWQTTGDMPTIDRIWPNIVAALEWMDSYGDPDGDGFLEYRRRRDSGLVNQGWKDSNDAVFHADGALAEAPIALCEVQGYAYLARIQAARLATARNDHAAATQLTAKAELLRQRFEAQFWDDDLGMYALALDGDKRPCRVRTSNAAQVLFTGIAAPDRAARMVAILAGSEFQSGWGIRTVSEREKRYNPASYHNGSIWPHDNSLVALGLARYGYSEQAASLTGSLLDAASHMDLRRLPELFCGMRRRREKGPILYPVACSPQAWAAGTPFALLQACMGLEIDASQGIARLRYPCLPDSVDELQVRGLPIGDARVDLVLRRHGQDVSVNMIRRSGSAEIGTLQR